MWIWGQLPTSQPVGERSKVLRRFGSTIPFMAAVLGCGVPVMAKPAEGQAVEQQDPVEPARPIGFERRDIEELDRKVEERRARWRAEEAARAGAKKQRRQGPVVPEAGVGLPLPERGHRLEDR